MPNLAIPSTIDQLKHTKYIQKRDTPQDTKKKGIKDRKNLAHPTPILPLTLQPLSQLPPNPSYSHPHLPKDPSPPPLPQPKPTPPPLSVPNDQTPLPHSNSPPLPLLLLHPHMASAAAGIPAAAASADTPGHYDIPGALHS